MGLILLRQVLPEGHSFYASALAKIAAGRKQRREKAECDRSLSEDSDRRTSEDSVLEENLEGATIFERGQRVSPCLEPIGSDSFFAGSREKKEAVVATHIASRGDARIEQTGRGDSPKASLGEEELFQDEMSVDLEAMRAVSKVQQEQLQRTFIEALHDVRDTISTQQEQLQRNLGDGFKEVRDAGQIQRMTDGLEAVRDTLSTLSRTLHEARPLTVEAVQKELDARVGVVSARIEKQDQLLRRELVEAVDSLRGDIFEAQRAYAKRSVETLQPATVTEATSRLTESFTVLSATASKDNDALTQTVADLGRKVDTQIAELH